MSAQPLLMLDIEGPSLSAEEREMLTHPGVGGLILFARNYVSPPQLDQLVAEIRAVNPAILLAVDQEGGRVQRFRDGFTRLPPMAALARVYDNDAERGCLQARQLGALMAAELVAHDIDISFAPVLDLDFGHSSVIGDRSFHADVDSLVSLAAAFIEGMADAGMAATGKHFPGHGFVAADSHLELPLDERSLAELEAADMRPFITLMPKLAGMMLAHIVYSQVDARPAGFSRQWLQQILRQQLGYRGLIFSDDLSMAGAAVVGDYAERAAAALDAGCDMVLVCNDRHGACAVLDYLDGCSPRSVVAATTLRHRRRPLAPDVLINARRSAAALLAARE